MAKRQTTPTPTIEVQQPQTLPHYLENMRPIFERLELFVGGDTKLQEELRRMIAEARVDSDKRGNIDAAFGKLIVMQVLPIEILGSLFDEKASRFLTRRATEFMACAKATGLTINNWSKDEARRVLAAYQAANPTPARRSLMAVLSSHTSSPFPSLEAWVNPRPRVTKEDAKTALDTQKRALELETQITALEAQESAAVAAKEYTKAGELAGQIAALRTELANLNETEVDEDEVHEDEIDEVPSPSLETQIAALEAQEFAAVAAKEYTKAGELAGQIAALRATMTTTTSASQPTRVETTVTTSPVLTAPAPNGNGKPLTLETAQRICKEPGAKKALRRAYARWENEDEFSDEAFIAMVADLTGNGATATA